MISNLMKKRPPGDNNNVSLPRSAEVVAVNNNNNGENLNEFAAATSKEKSLLCMPLNVIELNRILGGGGGNSHGDNRLVNSSLSSENRKTRENAAIAKNASDLKIGNKRTSFHRDVNEALSSLLWQPYEYQNKQMSDDDGASSSGSCCSLSSPDLERRPNNGRAQSPRSGNRADLHLTIEMVNNLGSRGSQWKETKGARDLAATSLPTNLLTNVSASEAAVEKVLVNRCNEFGSSYEAMRVEISNSVGLGDPSTSARAQVGAQGVVVNVKQNGGGESAVRPLPNHGYQRSISSDMIPSNLNSIVSANVVGLPNHPRHASVPSTTTPSRNSTGNAGGFIFPNHPRNASEPIAMVQQPVVVNHARNGSTPSTLAAANSRVTVNQNSSISCANIVSILSHHRHSSHVNGAELPALGPSRSASVPKSTNVSAVDVNFYRAVPVTVVSNVPSIQCVNEIGNNVSNVNIVQAMPPHRPTTTQVSVPPPTAEEPRARTFTSTEAQTDDASALVRTTTTATDRALTREQRRRERRERRHLRRANNSNHQHRSGLPDLLSNHMPPPYSPNHVNNAPIGLVHSIVPNNVPSGSGAGVVAASHVVPFHQPVAQVPLVQGGGPVAVPVPAPSGFRFPFPTAGFRRTRYSEEQPKSCCGLLAWKPGSLRWFIALIAVVAVCCVLVGTALGAMRPAGRDHLTVSLLMIGVGIVLVTVSGVAWRLTSHDSSTCRAMLGLGSTESVDVCPRRFVPRLPPSYGRPHHPYAAMIYPEFQYRPPPPSYQASMQEYRLRLLLLDRGHTPQIQAGVQNGPSPPPTYRSYAGSLLRAPLSSRRDASQSEYSVPPSYRSQTSSTRPAALDFQTSVIIHSREHSLSLSESNQGGSGTNDADSLKLAPANDINPIKMLLKNSSELDTSKEGNLVTIVQTSDQNPVIVTVSGCSQANTGSSVQITEIPTEMEILAHL